ncbi:hypothetical protein JNW98_06130 [Streptomyces sp. SCA2-4]|nr:hypothetical protein [Streptomyces huiliensis]
MAALLAAAAGSAVLGLAPAALADDHHRHHHHHGDDGYPVLVISPAPGRLTQEHKVTDTYQYDPKASGGSAASEASAGAQPPLAPASEPGAVTSVKDTANSAAQSATSGLSTTVDAALK